MKSTCRVFPWESEAPAELGIGSAGASPSHLLHLASCVTAFDVTCYGVNRQVLAWISTIADDWRCAIQLLQGKRPMPELSPGMRFRALLKVERPLQIVGAINAICAMQAAIAGFRALYLSGAGVANASHGLPDLGVTTLNDVVDDAARITAVCSLPLLVDIDTGWGTELTIQRAIRELERVGVAAVHMEDQVAAKRCGHRPGKELVSTEEMQARVRAAVASRNSPDLVIMARTDAVSVEGVDAAIQRAKAYVAAGADMIFAEAVETAKDFRRFSDEVKVPILANLTEFGRTPAFTLDQLKEVGVQMALYPLTAFRAMNAAAKTTYDTIRKSGSQQSILKSLQSRDELYEVLNYLEAEKRIDKQR